MNNLINKSNKTIFIELELEEINLINQLLGTVTLNNMKVDVQSLVQTLQKINTPINIPKVSTMNND